MHALASMRPELPALATARRLLERGRAAPLELLRGASILVRDEPQRFRRLEELARLDPVEAQVEWQRGHRHDELVSAAFAWAGAGVVTPALGLAAWHGLGVAELVALMRPALLARALASR